MDCVIVWIQGAIVEKGMRVIRVERYGGNSSASLGMLKGGYTKCGFVAQSCTLYKGRFTGRPIKR